jgi:hypothetical protein
MGDRPARCEHGDPGARNAEQERGNAASAALAPLREEQLAGVREVYDRLIRPHVHGRW